MRLTPVPTRSRIVNPVKVRNVRSLADAVEMYHRTGVFDMRVSDVQSYDLQSDGTPNFIRDVKTELMNCEGRCEDLMIAAATQMHSKSSREKQVTNITPSAPAVASPAGTGSGQ